MQDYSGTCPLCGETHYGSTSCYSCDARFAAFTKKYEHKFPYGIKSRYFYWEDFRDLCKIYFPNGLTDNWENEMRGRKLTEDELNRVKAIYRGVAQRMREKEAEERKQQANEKAVLDAMDPSIFDDTAKPVRISRKRRRKRHRK